MAKQEVITIQSFEEFIRLRFIDSDVEPKRDWFTIDYISDYKKKSIKILPLVDAGNLKKGKQFYLGQETTWEKVFAVAQIKLLDAIGSKAAC